MPLPGSSPVHPAIFLLSVTTSNAKLNAKRPIYSGDIFWLAPDPTRGVDAAHPHVVLQEDVLNHSRIATVVVCALTSNLQRANEPGNALLDPGEGDLPQRSVVVVSQVGSVDKTQLGHRIGALSEGRVQQILEGLRFQQRSFFGL